MWSNRYYYLNMYSDESLSTSFDVNKLRAFLESFTQIEKRTSHYFRNRSSYPYIELNLFYAKCLNTWHLGDTDDEKVNLIAIVCEKSETSFDEIKGAFIQIAKFLNWKLIDEQSDEGDEQAIIWKPEK